MITMYEHIENFGFTGNKMKVDNNSAIKRHYFLCNDLYRFDILLILASYNKSSINLKFKVRL